MKITLIKKEKKVIGWAMTVETDEDINVIEHIRDLNFWGSPSYNGRISNPNQDDVKTLSWVDKEYNNDGKHYTSVSDNPNSFIQEFLKTL